MEIVVSNIGITEVPADLIVLKFANDFYGPDQRVAKAIGFKEEVPLGKAKFRSGPGISAREAVFIGVGPLHDFRYEQIHAFGRTAVRLARTHDRPVYHLALTVSGPGYGLDVEQSFLSLIAGIVAEWKSDDVVKKFTIAERYDKRCELLQKILQDASSSFGLEKDPIHKKVMVSGVAPTAIGPEVAHNVIQFGTRAERKPRLFVAMPFADQYVDEFEIGFCESAKTNGFVCERLDLEAFVGDIVEEIKRRIIGSDGIIALLNDQNPNVFLELGFAFANNKPAVLVAREGLSVPFDVRGHRCIRYRSITELRELLSREIAGLKSRGVLRTDQKD
jgi:hypothetical protein